MLFICLLLLFIYSFYLLLFPICSFSIHPSNSFVTIPRAPITTRTTSTIFSLYNIPISLFQSWCFSTCSFSFSPTLTFAGTAVSMIILFRSFLSIKIMSGLLASITLSHWLLICHDIFTSSFSTALSRTCTHTVHAIVPCVLTHFC